MPVHPWMRIMAGGGAVLLSLMLPPATHADELTIEMDFISLNNALWARQPIALPFGAADAHGGVVRLRHDTQPECAASALRLVRDALNQTAVSAAALESLEVTADAVISLVAGYGLRRAANVAEVTLIYLTATDSEDFYLSLAEWLAGEGVSRSIVDDVAAEVASEMTEGIAGVFTEQFRRPILREVHEHPQCGEISVSYRLVPGYEEETYSWDGLDYGTPILRFRSDGDCHRRWPLNRGDQLGLFQLFVEMPVTGTAVDGDAARLTVGEPHYSVLALCGDQNDRIAYDTAEAGVPPPEIVSFLPHHGPTGNWYFLGEETGTWEEGRAWCRSFGADLAVLADEGEHAFLAEHLVGACHNRNGCWIGASDAVSEGEFRWIDGTALEGVPWRSGEPNDFCSGEDYVHMMRNGALNDQAVDGSCGGWGLMQPVCEAGAAGNRL
ncbi:MAG: lectin-like protein [Azospirillaceae bacterium]